METEAKLAFKDKESLYGLASADFFREFCVDKTEPERVLLENSYLDTADTDISKRGGMIRKRHYVSSTQDSYEFTVKYGGSVSAGLHRRFEWNMKSSDGIFSVDGFKRNVSEGEDPSEMLSEAFGNIKDENLKVICSNSFYRTCHNLKYGDSMIEACFDSGIIKSSDGSKTDEICELELELISGRIEDVKDLSALIMGKTGCSPFEDTKYRRTFALGTGN